jgi:hypothetical protein
MDAADEASRREAEQRRSDRYRRLRGVGPVSLRLDRPRARRGSRRCVIESGVVVVVGLGVGLRSSSVCGHRVVPPGCAGLLRAGAALRITSQ